MWVSEVGDVKIFGKLTMAEDDGLKLMVKSIQVFQGGVEKDVSFLRLESFEREATASSIFFDSLSRSLLDQQV